MQIRWHDNIDKWNVCDIGSLTKQSKTDYDLCALIKDSKLYTILSV